jgi:DNA replication protein DnaC
VDVEKVMQEAREKSTRSSPPKRRDREAEQETERRRIRERCEDRYRSRIDNIPHRYREYTLRDCESYAESSGKKAAYELARRFVGSGGSIVERDRERKALLIGGGFGVGKTVLATASYKALVWRLDHPDDPDPSITGLWSKWHQVVSEIQSTYSAAAQEDRDTVLARYQNTDVLLLDDVGDLDREMESDDRRRILHEIIDARNDWMRPTLITTNLAGHGEIEHQFGTRTWERIREMCGFVLMKGANLRDEDLAESTESHSTP